MNLKKYNLSHDQYMQIKNHQGICCAICQQDVPLHIDHCHSTGVVRGLLCCRCNTAIGQMKDNISWLQSAIDYLLSYPTSIIGITAIAKIKKYPKTKKSKKNKFKLSVAAQKMIANKKMIFRCEHCNAEFNPKKIGAKFCSHKCRQKNHRCKISNVISI